MPDEELKELLALLEDTNKVSLVPSSNRSGYEAKQSDIVIYLACVCAHNLIINRSGVGIAAPAAPLSTALGTLKSASVAKGHKPSDPR